MKLSQREVISVLLAGLWIAFSEFLRNQLLLKHYWTDLYASLGIEFPSESINGAIWGFWSMSLAIVIYLLLQKFTQKATLAIAWFMAFVMMWLVIGNLSVLPVRLLLFAIPLSLLEVYIAILIITKLSVANKINK